MANNNRLIVKQSEYIAGNITSGIISSASTVSGLQANTPYFAFALSDASPFTTSVILSVIQSVSNATGLEGTGLIHTVNLNLATTISQSFAFSLTSGTAIAGTDFSTTPTFSNGVTLSGGNITVPAGVSSFTVTILTIDDAITESSEAYNLSIGGVIAGGTITDNDGYVPITTNATTFNAAGLKRNLSGMYNELSNTNRLFLPASFGVWAGWIKASSAQMLLNNGSPPSNPIEVSINGGAFYNATQISGVNYQLFTGLPDTEKFVVLRAGSAYGIDNVWFDKTVPTILTLSGTNTYVRFVDEYIYTGINSSKGVVASAIKPNTFANHFPSVIRGTNPNVNSVSNIGSAKIRGAFRNIIISTTNNTQNPSPYYLSIDGAEPIKYTDTNAVGSFVIPNLDGLVHDYYVWSGNYFGWTTSVGGDSEMLPTTASQLHQFGDSITNGVGTYGGDVDTLGIAAALGRVGLTLGISGLTTEQLNTVMDSYLASLTVASTDVAIIAIGRNDSTFTTAIQTAYTSMINKLLTKGYGKVLCRGVNKDGNGVNAGGAYNPGLSSLVASINNPNVKYIDPSNLPTYTTHANDSVHPDAAGYTVLRNYYLPLYQLALA